MQSNAVLEGPLRVYVKGLAAPFPIPILCLHTQKLPYDSAHSADKSCSAFKTSSRAQ